MVVDGIHNDRNNTGRHSMAGNDEWMTAAAAIALLRKHDHSAYSTICKRAHGGLIGARADRYIRDGRLVDDVEVPIGFWWAEGEAALQQNWVTGDFETWIAKRIHLQAFGVRFRRLDIEKLIPSPDAEYKSDSAAVRSGRKVFIGHGRSPVWRELKDFLEGPLGLAIAEFNSVPTAGRTTTDRLEELLRESGFAFLIMTAEDEQPDRTFNPRMNVVHEAGLFQGRLGFKRAIMLREDGCEEFSNIHGLNSICFPPGGISSKFEEIRSVFHREGLIT